MRISAFDQLKMPNKMNLNLELIGFNSPSDFLI